MVSYTRTMPLPLPRWLGVTAACLCAPLAAAAGWIPLRESFSNLDVALLLILVVMAVGSLGSFPGTLLGAASAAWWFDFFDTRPYSDPTIARRPDLVTFLVLATVGATVGTMSTAYARRRRMNRLGDADVGRLRAVAELLATATELVEILPVIAEEIGDVLGLSECWFAAAAAGGQVSDEAPEAPRVTRSGVVALTGPSWQALLPVWAQGEVLGHFVVSGGADPPEQDRWVLAVALADQAGAALAAHGVLPPPPQDPPQPRLRVLEGRPREGVGWMSRREGRAAHRLSA